MHNQSKTVTHPKGFEVKTTTKAGGYCKKMEPAKYIQLYNNSDPVCCIGTDDNCSWDTFHVAEFSNGNFAGKGYDQQCCTNWVD